MQEVKFSIIKVEEYPNCEKVTIQTKINGKTMEERFSFSPEQRENDTWKNVIKAWILKQKSTHPKSLKKLEGKKITV